MRIRQVLFLLLGCAVQAQTQTTTRVVSGIVFDSLTRAPLSGAVVQIALVDATKKDALNEGSPRVFSGTADSSGHFRILGLPSGQFAIGFQHEALNALGLESPLRAFELGKDSSVTVNLAIPAGPAVRAQLCGEQTRLPGEGMLAGYVLDAKGEQLLKGAVVRAHWMELAFEKNNYRTLTRTVTAVVDDDGRYLACGLTSDEAVSIEVTMAGHRDIRNTIAVPVGGALRQDFHLADAGASSGTGRVTGRVTLADGSALATGHAFIDALSLDVPVEDGDFAFTGLPPGTWVIETRAIGYDPKSAMVHLTEHGITPAMIALSERAQVLDAVTVRGRRGGSSKILAAIASRRSTSVGTVFLPGNPWLESAYDPGDVARAAAGFRYVNADVLLASGCGFRYPPSDEPAAPLTSARGRTKTLAVYLDGARVMGGLTELRTSVTMRDVLAVEAYQEISQAPLEWRTYDACAVLAIWTRR